MLGHVRLLPIAGLILLVPTLVRADGGTVRLSERVGAYQVTIFTSPTPLRVGPVDVSVLVQDAVSGRPLDDAAITVRLTSVRQATPPQEQPATTQAATNRLLRAALFELPAAGPWHIDVAVNGPHGPAQAHVTVEVSDALPRWTALAGWIAAPLVPILLFALHQVLVHRKKTHGAP